MIEAKRTPVEAIDVARAMRAAWISVLGDPPANQQLAVLLAQSALETGRWKSCWNWNLGNQKAGSKWTGETYQVRCSEIIKGREVFFDPPHPQTTFRAYASLADGVADYLWLLRRRFSRAWEFVLRGDPEAFSRMLKATGYYTASEAQYTKSLKSLFGTYLKLLNSQESSPDLDAAPDTEPDGNGLEALALSIAATAAVDATREDRDGQEDD